MAVVVSRDLAVRSGLWSVVESGGLTILSFVALLALSRLLTAADFGLFSITLGIVEMLGLISNMTFHDALVQHADPQDCHFDTAFSIAFLTAAVLTLICWAVGPHYDNILHDERAGPVLATLSLGMLVSGPVSTIVAKQKRDFGFRRLAQRSIAGRLAGFFLGVAMAWAGYGVWSLVIQYLAMQAFGSVILFATCDRLPRPRLNWDAASELLSFGAPAIGAQIVSFAIKRVLTLGIGIFLGEIVSGYINLAMRIVDTFWAVAAAALSQVTLSALTSLRDDPERRRSAYRRATLMAVALFAPVFVGMAATAPEVVGVLFGAKWLPAAPFVSGIAAVTALSATHMLATPLLTAIGRPKQLLAINAANLALVVIAVAITRLPTGNIVIVTLLGSQILMMVMLWRAVAHHGGISVKDQVLPLARTLLAAILMGAIVMGLRTLMPSGIPDAVRLAILVAAGAVSYGALLALLDQRAFAEMITLVPGFKRRSPKGVLT